MERSGAWVSGRADNTSSRSFCGENFFSSPDGKWNSRIGTARCYIIH